MVVIVTSRPQTANVSADLTTFYGDWANSDFAEALGTIDIISSNAILYVNIIDGYATNRNDELYQVQVGSTITATNTGERAMTVTTVDEVSYLPYWKYFVFGINEDSDDEFDYANDVTTTLVFTGTSPIVAEPHVINMPGDDPAVPDGEVFLEGVDLTYAGSSNLDLEVLLDGVQNTISTNKSLAILNDELNNGEHNLNLGGPGSYTVTVRVRRTGQTRWVDAQVVNFGVE